MRVPPLPALGGQFLPARWRVAAALLGLALVLGGGAPPGRAQAPTGLVVALGSEPDRLFNSTSDAAQLVSNLVYDPLVGLDDQMQPYPVLAATIPGPDNGLVQITGSGPNRRLEVTMPLRQGVTWSDGQPFTADDVVYMWQLMMNPDAGFDTEVEGKIRNVDKVDDHTVRFVYLSANEARALDPDRYKDQGDNPVVDPLYRFGLYDAPAIYPSHVLRRVIGDDPRHSKQVANLATSSLATQPLGTGPYVLSDWEPGSALTFTARGDDIPQRQGQPKIGSITFRVEPDKNASLTELSAGAVQLVTHDGLDATDAPVLDRLPGVQAHYVPGRAWEQLTFNLDAPALGDPVVRRALALAIDRVQLNEQVLAGKGVVPITQLPPWSWAFDPDVPALDHDPDQAQKLLDQAGWGRAADGVRQKGGRRLSLVCVTPGGGFRAALLGALKAQLAQVGVDLQVQTAPAATVFDTAPSAPQALVARQFDVAEFAWVSGYDPGADQTYTLHSRNVPTADSGWRGGNYGDYKSRRSDQLLDYVQSSLDEGGRKAAFGELQQLWQQDLPILPLVLRPVTTAAATGLQNYRPTPAPQGETWNVEQWELAR
jgi:peptide/nickel transport system substrate-binding protein